MDAIGWYVATMHQMLGHDQTAAFIGQPPGSKDACVICQYERNPNDLSRQAVIRTLASKTETAAKDPGALSEPPLDAKENK